jgi:hypothetical protein
VPTAGDTVTSANIAAAVNAACTGELIQVVANDLQGSTLADRVETEG